MKNTHLCMLYIVLLMLSCTHEKKHGAQIFAQDSSNNTQPTLRVDSERKLSSDSSESRTRSDVQPLLNYSFSNDTICENIAISLKTTSNKSEIPKSLQFRLRLHDEQNKLKDIILEGSAKLFSSEESFNDSSERDGGAYDAADYNFSSKNYDIMIRIDEQNYSACVISIKSSQTTSDLDRYKSFLKEFPNKGVLKIGICR